MLGKPFSAKDEMGRRHRKLAGRLGDAVPESLQIADLFGLREGVEPREARGAAFVPALARSRGHAATLRTGAIFASTRTKGYAAQLASPSRRRTQAVAVEEAGEGETLSQKLDIEPRASPGYGLISEGTDGPSTRNATDTTTERPA